eukprot:SAG31_NODE_2096_length_6455_cov_2.145060_1_plen_84_part_10
MTALAYATAARQLHWRRARGSSQCSNDWALRPPNAPPGVQRAAEAPSLPAAPGRRWRPALRCALWLDRWAPAAYRTVGTRVLGR